MKRIMMVLTVAALMVAMMVASALPIMAQEDAPTLVHTGEEPYGVLLPENEMGTAPEYINTPPEALPGYLCLSPINRPPPCADIGGGD